MKVERVSFKSEGELINGDLYTPDIEKPPIIVLCHGLGGSRGLYSKNGITIAKEFCKKGFAVLAFSFRGHDEDNKNSKKLTITRAVKDAMAAINFVENKNFDSEKISLVGRSFGGMVSIIVASKDKRIKTLTTWATPINVAFLENNKKEIKNKLEKQGYYEYTDYTTLGKCFFDDLKKYNLLEYVKKIKIPFLVVHGAEDNDVNASNAKKIYKNANKPKKLEIIENVDHDTISFIDKGIVDITAKWVKRWLK